MSVQALGYIGLRAKDLGDWAKFGSDFLGMQRIDKTRASMAFRMDDRKQRVIIDADGGQGIGYFGWEVADAAAMEALAAKLEAAGVKVARGSRALADERHVKDLIVFQDPAGTRIEAFHGPEVAEHAVRARPQHLGLPHRAARHGPCGAALRGHRADDAPSTKACSASASATISCGPIRRASSTAIRAIIRSRSRRRARTRRIT